MIDRAAIRVLAAQHIREIGLVQPPFDHQASLQARRLDIAATPLEAILAESPLPKEDRDKIDGFIDLQERIVCLRQGLHRHQRRTGLLHEVAHDLIPWQRDLLLHYCPIFSLPPDLQEQFEREANVFAAECTFFADQFPERLAAHPNHLRSAMDLAIDHDASYEATFRHYVECHAAHCLLLVSTIVDSGQDTDEPSFEVRQYIRSPAAPMKILPGQRFGSSELTALVLSPTDDIALIDHEVSISSQGTVRRFTSQSFWNSYKLFTLLWL